ncbi:MULTISPECIES: RluA family pseudouridine synthase [Kordiimonas]|jgi:23S rRNA pseudouridine955/2504/2580 synthase|uniref:RluA family pseudouridine synthase n=1 Tax=Kordiimonas TaxID=288021 RepID=UPI00257EF0D0|nr:RluA family pseudouridine synthase [Kordiimonas sp. UBA4487]
MSNVKNITVKADDDGIRIDRWFKRHFPEVPFGTLQKKMRKGEIRLDGKRVKGPERVEEGQVVRVPPLGDMPEPPKREPKPRLSDKDIKEVQSWVLYKDDHVIAINKPAGLPTQGGTGQTRHLDGLLDALRFGSEHRPRLVHRLDKDTSGVLLLGRTPNAAAALANAFKTKETDKRYWALVIGCPNPRDGRIILNMSKAPIKGNERMVADPNGQHSLTDYAVVDNAGQQAAWVALKPHTGRTHQLRLHCTEMGHPIVGDGKYGGGDAFLSGAISKKLHLHSHTVRFPHPAGGRASVTAPLSPHMAESFNMLGFEVGEYEDPLVEDGA